MRLSALCALVGCATAPALASAQASPPPGRYTMTLMASDSVPAFYYGTWTLAVGADRSYRLMQASDTVIVGKFTAPKAGWIVLTDLSGDGACESETASGAYDWKLTKDRLTLGPTDEPCRQRAVALSSKAWHREP